jgi:hypothetical protein
MKRNLLSAMVGAVALVALTAGCAHGNGSESKGVRVVSNSQDVQNCEKLSQVRLAGTWTSGAAKEELENLVRSKGGNVLLLSGGSGTPNAGVAYRCSGGTSTGSP